MGLYNLYRSFRGIRTWKTKLIHRATDRNKIIFHYSDELKPYKFGFSMSRFPGRWKETIPPEVIVSTILNRRFIHPEKVLKIDDEEPYQLARTCSQEF